VNVKRFENRIYLSSPTMHGEERTYMLEAYDSNWMTTVGENIDEIEREMAGYIGCEDAVGLSSGTAALHLAVKLAGVTRGDRVFCSDLTFAASVNPVIYEGATPIFIDSERDTWNMDPVALEKAFSLYPDVKVVIAVDLYGVPAKLQEIRDICDRHGALLIEDAAEALGASHQGRKVGSFGAYNVLSFNGNKIITGSTGGMLVTNQKEAADRTRKWSTQSRDDAPWYHHTELGYNYRMSNVVAGVVRGQYLHLQEHLDRKKEIYNRYKEGLKDLPVTMNPYDADSMEPSFWLSCLLIDQEAMSEQRRSDLTVTYTKADGKTCPTEVLETFERYNIEGRPTWKPMHMHPLYAAYPFVAIEEGDGVSGDLFERGICLPSDIKMTDEQQDAVIALIRSCF